MMKNLKTNLPPFLRLFRHSDEYTVGKSFFTHNVDLGLEYLWIHRNF